MKIYKSSIWVMIAVLCLSLIGMVGSFFDQSLVAEADQVIQQNSVADETSDRSITIWKYQVKDASELGDRGDGLATTIDKTPLAGIKFKIERVEALNDISLTDPKKATLGTDYQVITTPGETTAGQGVTVTTKEDGSIKISLGKGTSADGIYLVTELADDRGVKPAVAKPADPFFVYVPQTKREDRSSLIYDVEVFPKNILESLLNPDKTIEEGKGYSIKAGEKFTWEANANLPSGLYYVAAQDSMINLYDEAGNLLTDKHPIVKGTEIYADYFTITDTLNKELLVDNVIVQTKNDTSTWTELNLASDYTIKINDTAKIKAPIADTTLASKKVVVDLTKSGMKKVTEKSDTKIRVVYTTHTDKNYNGEISNHFDVAFLTPGLQPVIIPSEEDPEYYVGGFDIKKTGEDTKTVLAEAEFHLATNEANAKGGKFLAENGQSYTESEALTAGVKLLLAISDANGRAEFNGLKLSWYQDTNNNDKQDTNEPTFAKKDIKQSYWVVETKAPKGYEVLKTAQEVVVTLATADNDTIELNVVNKAKTDLPFTGGDGMTFLVVVAMGAITIGAIAIVIDKRRRRA